jgi:predicted Rossmann fold nucleotide-binding protein DprA/Smf involved in DNA uptake
MAAPTNKGPPTLSKQQAKEIFFDSEEKKFESMKAMMQNQKGPMSSQEDQMEAMVEMMVQQAILADDMFERHGVEEEEFNSAVMHYQLMNDPEVYKKMMESM